MSRDLVDPAASGVFVGLEMPAPTQARSRVLTDDEIRRLWPAIQNEPPREAAFWELAFCTGQRKGEILAATFEQFATPHEWRFIVKGGREHWLGLPRQVDDILARLRVLAGKSPYIFASREAESGHLATLQKSLGRLRSATGHRLPHPRHPPDGRDEAGRAWDHGRRGVQGAQPFSRRRRSGHHPPPLQPRSIGGTHTEGPPDVERSPRLDHLGEAHASAGTFGPLKDRDGLGRALLGGHRVICFVISRSTVQSRSPAP